MFVRWVPWDICDDVRQMAFSCSGYYLRSHSDPELFEAILHIAEDVAELADTRDNACRALAVAMGDAVESLPPATRVARPGDAWCADVVERARQAARIP